MLLDVASVLSSLIDREWRPIRIEFLTLQDKPNSHAWGAQSPTQYFPFLPGLWNRVTPLDYIVRLLYTRMLRILDFVQKRVKVKRSSWTSSKRGESKVHSPVQSSTLLTDYHISQHVASTFKRLTKLPHISSLCHFTKLTGSPSQVTTVDPIYKPYYFNVVVEHFRACNLASSRNYSTFTDPN